jgi:mono/diheme cytochrome c family protein
MLEACGATNEACIIRQFKDTPEASVLRGRIVFENCCTFCHGAQVQRNGGAARLHTPPPANLVASRMPAEYLTLIIRKGGEAVGRGKGMPPWNKQLTDEQIRDVVSHLVAFRK